MTGQDQPSAAGASGDAGYFDRSDPWCLRQVRHLPALAARDETLFCLANGFLGVRGGFEEAPSASSATFLAEAYARSPISYHERFPGFARTTDTRVPVADAARITIRLDDETLNIHAAEWLVFERCLDLRRGCSTRVLRLRSAGGVTLEIQAQRLVALDVPGLLCIRFSVQSIDFTGRITLDSAIEAQQRSPAQGDDPRIGAGSGLGMQVLHTSATADAAGLLQAAPGSGVQVACAQRHLLCGDGLSAMASHTRADGVHQSFAGTLRPGASVTLEKYVAYAWSGAGQEPPGMALLEAAGELAMRSAQRGFAALAGAQADAWAGFWHDSDIAIDGATEVELALRFNLFHLYQSVGRAGRASIAAKGLTGEGYEGHYFWDAETFVLPVFALTAPALARGMLEYRHATLAQARRHAREMNHARGALFAWRTISGDECSAYFPSGSAQYHINAAIAFALRQYMDASDDIDFLCRHGAELLFETARIWLQIGHFSDRRDGAFCIHEVTGPDEYSALVDNNFYTNRMAQAHLRYAVAVAHLLVAEHAADFAALSEHLALDAGEIAEWSRAAETMLLRQDPVLAIFPQDEGFLDKPRWPFAASGQPLLLQFHPLTIYRHQVCKQADVLLALVLAGEGIERTQKQRNFDYYEAITVHDSTLSASTFSILAMEIGYAERAYAYFLDTLRVDLDDLHGNTDHGAHMAAMAGSWMALSWGFAGMRILAGRLSFAPTLPAGWNGYRLALQWRGARLQVAVDRHHVSYTLRGGRALALWHAGERLLLDAGSVVRVAHGATAASAERRGLAQSTGFPRRFAAVIFDLDGVLADTAQVHAAAWQRLADEIGVPFDAADGERLKGVDREASLEIVLERATRRYDAAEKAALAARKNAYYRAAIETFDARQLLPGARAALDAARTAGLKIGLASASKNAGLLLMRLGVAGLFDYVADAALIKRAKPDPEIFLHVADALGVAPGDCLGIEDAVAGIASIKAAGMTALGIGDAAVLHAADVVLPRIGDLCLSDFVLPQ